MVRFVHILQQKKVAKWGVRMCNIAFAKEAALNEHNITQHMANVKIESEKNVIFNITRRRTKIAMR